MESYVIRVTYPKPMGTGLVSVYVSYAYKRSGVYHFGLTNTMGNPLLAAHRFSDLTEARQMRLRFRRQLDSKSLRWDGLDISRTKLEVVRVV